MALYVYVTNECKEDAREHAIQKQLNQFRDRIQKCQRTTFFDNFPPPYLKKRFTRQLRLIAGEKMIGEHVVVVLYRILVRGGSEYPKFLDSPKKYGDACFLPLVSDDTLKEWLKQETAEPTEKKQKPTDEEFRLLYGLSGNKDFFSGDYFIYETQNWIKAVRNTQILNRFSRTQLADAIMEIIDHKKNTGSESLDKDYSIFYHLCTENRILVLKDICLNSEYKEHLDTEDFDAINRQSGKCYPESILVDIDLWSNIEEESESNIALSPEEMKILRSVHEPDPEGGFPLFINGGAGSGKSTILQYLFVDYLRLYNSMDKIELNNPIYLTYSTSLVEKCQRIVTGLMKFHYKNISGSPDFDAEMINNSIKDFKSFLLSKIRENDQKGLFPVDDDSYIDYANFKKRWHDHFANDPNALKDYGPDISWHIIRSYIKGTSIDDFLEEEEYKELPKEEKTVTEETFQLVYHKVWQNWYKDICQVSNGKRLGWDDQDLVRYLLDNDMVAPKYPAIFCDEAQDFTRLELELLLRLSIFTERTVNTDVLKRIPFAFAGDPFQTLNPTGFRWESVKSSFTEKFIYSLAPELRFGNPQLNYKELEYNYRSSENIVKLANSIQLLRVYLFDYKNVSCQKIWHIEESSSPTEYFFVEGLKVQQQMKDQDDLIIIVPCNEGEEGEFVARDKYLKDIIPIDEQGVPQNVFSPMRAKGLEFHTVVLYRFASEMPKLLDFSKDQTNPVKNLSIDKKIPLEYFVNQLYVGATRAEKKLMVFEEKNGIQTLWRFVSDAAYQDNILLAHKGKHDWENNLGSLIEGEDIGPNAKQGKDNAQKMEKEGKLNRDPYLLRQAAMRYDSIGNQSKKYECRALACEFEGDLKRAGEQYVKIPQFDKALDSYWKGKNYSEIAKLSKNELARAIASDIRVRICDVMDNPKTFSAMKPTLKILEQHFKEGEIEEEGKKNWSKCINKLLQVLRQQNIIKKVEEYNEFYKLIISFGVDELLSPDLMANLSYHAEQYHDSTKWFEQAGDINNPHYQKAKIGILIDQFQEQPSSLTDSEKSFLSDYYFSKKAYIKAFSLDKSLQDVKRIERYLSESAIAEPNLIDTVIKTYIRLLVQKGRWLELVNLFDIYNKSSFVQMKRQYGDKLNQYLNYTIVEMATSELVEAADNKIKEKISDFLKEYFITRTPAEWQDDLAPEVIGCALEKANRHIDCLQFYESVQKYNSFDSETKQRAQMRWIIVKLRQAEREESMDKTTRAKKHRSEADKQMRELGLRKINEPDYPDITEFIPASQQQTELHDKIGTGNIDDKIQDLKAGDLQKRFNIELSDFRFTVDRGNNRINIETIENAYQAAVLIDDKICKSADVDFEKKNGDFVAEKMKLAVSFKNNRILFKLQNLGVSFEIE
ncbi:hypothetical protein GF407_16535 [candidate division KSB1 bacterium]|nr:hypothetical protein [candidate division KSB1 bacterium]